MTKKERERETGICEECLSCLHKQTSEFGLNAMHGWNIPSPLKKSFKYLTFSSLSFHAKMCVRKERLQPHQPKFPRWCLLFVEQWGGVAGVNNKKKFKFRIAIGTFNQIKQMRNIRAKEEEKNKRRKLISKAIQIFPWIRVTLKKVCLPFKLKKMPIWPAKAFLKSQLWVEIWVSFCPPF